MKATVISAGKMNKTVGVVVKRYVKHPLYKKYIRRSSKYLVHDEKNKCRIGDVVLIKESKPISKLKRWYVAKIISRGGEEEI